MMIRYRRLVCGGGILFVFFIVLDWLISPKHIPRIESPQTDILIEDWGARRSMAGQRVIRPGKDPLEDEQLLPVSHQLWEWIPGVPSQKQRTDIPQIAAMKKTLSMLNQNMTSPDDPRLLDVIRKFWLRPPSLEPYKLQDPNLKDFSKGQSVIVDDLLHQKENGVFIECGALDGETRSNSLFFERERGWTGLLIEAGPLNYRRLVKKNRQSYSTPACLGVHPYPTKMYFHRGKNRGRLIDGKEALEWVRKQAMSVWLMEVQCFPLYSLLAAINHTRVDYFSLDVEGVELEVLQTIPWDRVHIEVLTVEFAHDKGGKDTLRRYMEARGYETITEVARLDGLANDLVFKKVLGGDKVPIMEK